MPNPDPQGILRFYGETMDWQYVVNSRSANNRFRFVPRSQYGRHRWPLSVASQLSAISLEPRSGSATSWQELECPPQKQGVRWRYPDRPPNIHQRRPAGFEKASGLVYIE